MSTLQLRGRHALGQRFAAAIFAGTLLLSGAPLGSAILLSAPANADPVTDRDGDGLSTEEELRLGTSPNNPDSDGDGLTDGRELKTDPKNADTDGDGSSDGEEVNGFPATDPLSPGANRPRRDPPPAESPAPAQGRDTDGDGLSNDDELRRFTNVFIPDTDLDGVNDGDEVKNGTNPLNVFDN